MGKSRTGLNLRQLSKPIGRHPLIEGEPSRISLSCLACQRRTGAAISDQARLRLDQVTFAGKSTQWMRTAESGNAMTFHFCPTCGSTVYWENEGFPGYATVAIGNFAGPVFPRRPPYGSRHAIPGFPCHPTRRPSAWRSRDKRWPTSFFFMVQPSRAELRRMRISRLCLKKGVFFSGTWTAAPVLGFRPTRSSRTFTENEPKPRNSTRSPRANAATISSKTASTAFSTSR
jgi:hypothetical protein